MEHNKEKYPVLKETVRIKKFPNFCWIIELITDCNRAIAPLEAFLLANCTGEWNPEQICYLTEQTYGLEPEAVRTIVYKTLKELGACVDWLEKPERKAQRYAPSDFLYHTKKGVLAKQERCDTPCELFLSLTNACNFRCIYCFNASGQDKYTEIETETWLHCIRQAGAMGVLKCTLTGGEPMLYKGFYDILQELARQDIMPYICTNGSLIDEEAVERFQALGVRAVQISMDSAVPDIHHKLTATNDSFIKVVRGIERLTAAGISVNVKTVLTPCNLQDIQKLIALCNRIGVNKLTLDRFDVSACGRGGAELLISERQMEEVKTLIAESRKQIADKMSVEATSNTKKWKDEKDIIFCGAFRRTMVILPNGDVSVCEKLMDVPEMTVGNIGRDSLLDIWNSEKIADILSPPQEKRDAVCKECAHLEQCGAGCFAIKYFLKQNPFGMDPRCWRASKENNPYAEL